jgi:hypothetical protein
MGIKKILHSAALLSFKGEHLRFCRALGALERTQRQRLSETLAEVSGTEWGKTCGLDSRWTAEKFAERIPVHRYSDHQPWIERQKKSPDRKIGPGPIRYFEPTSGSTEARKWIPYTQSFLNEINRAAGTWLVDLSTQSPEAFEGSHYWSLSWLPSDLRKEKYQAQDWKLFPWGQRLLLGQIMAVGPKISELPTVQSVMRETARILLRRRDLSLISVWSPTFLLELIEEMKSLDPDFRAEPEYLRGLWPRLRLLSAWDSSSSRGFADRLKDLFPHVAFQGKGVWATEGVVTFPFRGRKVLASRSHFFEFRDLSSGRLHFAWDLREGQEVQPLLTTSSGLLRYEMQDRLKVTGFLEETPCFEFLGRLRSVDLVGEKLGVETVETLFRDFQTRFSAEPLCLLGLKKRTTPHYRALIETTAVGQEKQMAGWLEEKLLGWHHYRLAREMGQLGPLDVEVSDRAWDVYKTYRRNAGLQGQLKLERLLEVEE